MSTTFAWAFPLENWLARCSGNRGPPESNGQRSVETLSKIQREKFSFGMTREGNPELSWDEGGDQENSSIILFSDIS